MRILFVSGVLLFAAILTGSSFTHGQGAKEKQPDPAQALPHEGSGVDGLQLRVEAEFMPEEKNWGSPQLETRFTFLNKTNQTILLDGFTMHHRVVLSRVSPLDGVKIRFDQEPPFCPREEPGPKHIIRIPPLGSHVIKTWQWCDTLSIPYGGSDKGRVVDGTSTQVFKLPRSGKLTLAFMYRSDGAFAVSKELSKYLQKGEQFWSGQVYSNPVTILLSPPHQEKPVTANYTGVLVENYPSGKKRGETHYKNGKQDGLQVLFWPLGTKRSEEHFKDGLSHGAFIRYHHEGWKEFETTSQQGQTVGPHIWWYPNGKKELQQEFKNGKEDGLRISWFKNGQKATQVTYKDHQYYGLYLEWHENGKKACESFYKNGKIEGLYLTWHENGQKAFEGFYKNGEIQGTPKRWDENGKVTD